MIGPATSDRGETLDTGLASRHRAVTIEACADGIAHEFKNVLQIIRGYVAFAERSLPPESEAAADLAQALIAVDRATDVAHQLLATARAEDDEQEVFDANELLLSMAKMLQPVIGCEIELAVGVAVDPVNLMGYSGSVRQMIINLCLNARDAMPHGGRLLLRAERFSTEIPRDDIGRGIEPGDYVRVSVSDSGSGVSPENVDRLFEPYFSTKRVEEGSGLGLTVVRQLVESHGGAITAHSVAGEGTTMTLFLPIDSQRQKTAAASPSAPEGELLLVGDRTQDIGATLSRAGWRARVAGSCDGGECVATLVLDDASPSLIDEALEVADGGPIIGISRFDPESFLVRPSLARCDAVLADPVDLNRLRRLIDGSRGRPESECAPETTPTCCAVGADTDRFAEATP